MRIIFVSYRISGQVSSLRCSLIRCASFGAIVADICFKDFTVMESFLGAVPTCFKSMYCVPDFLCICWVHKNCVLLYSVTYWHNRLIYIWVIIFCANVSPKLIISRANECSYQNWTKPSATLLMCAQLMAKELKPAVSRDVTISISCPRRPAVFKLRRTFVEVQRDIFSKPWVL